LFNINCTYDGTNSRDVSQYIFEGNLKTKR
jgi:hypothetical protein